MYSLNGTVCDRATTVHDRVRTVSSIAADLTMRAAGSGVAAYPPLFVGQPDLPRCIDGSSDAVPPQAACMSHQPAPPQPVTVYLCDLPDAVSVSLLTELLIQFGPLIGSARIPRGPDGKPRGIAFADFATRASAEYAINVLNGFSLDGQELKVSLDHKSSTSKTSAESIRRTDAGAPVERTAEAEAEAKGVLDMVDKVHQGPYKILQCVYFAKGQCKRGEACTYAHGEEEERVHREATEQRRQEQQQSRGKLLEMELEQQRQLFNQQLKQQQLQFQNMARQQQFYLVEQHRLSRPCQIPVHGNRAPQQLALFQAIKRAGTESTCHYRTDDDNNNNQHRIYQHLSIGPTNAHTTRDQVAYFLSEHGEVKSVLLQPHCNYAIVCMGSLEQANRAIAGLHGRVIGQGVGQFRLQLQLLSWTDARDARAALLQALW